MPLKIDRVYIIKTKPGDIERMKQLCLDYDINDNGVFEHAASFHFAWGLSPDGLIYLSPTTFLYQKPDFNSIEEFEAFLDKVFISDKQA